MLQLTLMQSFHPSPQPPTDGGPDEPVPPEYAATPRSTFSTNGHGTDDLGSAVYVAAWDAHEGHAAAAVADRRRVQNLRVIREVVETAILALVIFLGVRAVVQNFRVEGMSMEPTHHTGQYVLVNKLLYARLDLKEISDWVPFWSSDDESHYLFHRPRRGDVVVFDPPYPNRGAGEIIRRRDYIKRVIGEPGDHVVVKDGRVSVNGQQLDEQYLGGVQTFCGGQWCDLTLGPDEYFVMGDNRANSSDARLWGPVTGDRIVGKT